MQRLYEYYARLTAVMDMVLADENTDSYIYNSRNIADKISMVVDDLYAILCALRHLGHNGSVTLNLRKLLTDNRHTRFRRDYSVLNTIVRVNKYTRAVASHLEHRTNLQ